MLDHLKIYTYLIAPLLTCCTPTSPTQTNQEKPTEPEFRNGPLTAISAQVNLEDRQVLFQCVVLHEDDIDFKVLDNGPTRSSPRYKSLQEALEQNGCIAGTNGGFFVVDRFEPQGLMISAGTPTGKFDPMSWMKGVFMVDGLSPQLAHVSEFAEGPEISEMFQSGPWLVRGGKPETGFDNNNDTPRRRSFIGRDKNGKWILGICKYATLLELAALLSKHPIQDHIEINQALNLDGGPSTGYYFRKADQGSIYVPERWRPRNFIGVKVKST